MNGTEAAVFREFMSTLPRTERLILLLHYADGLTPLEIGAVLHLDEDHVAAWLERLRARARRLLRAVEAADPGPVVTATA